MEFQPPPQKKVFRCGGIGPYENPRNGKQSSGGLLDETNSLNVEVLIKQVLGFVLRFSRASRAGFCRSGIQGQPSDPTSSKQISE